MSRLTVLLPVYDGASYLREAIESILNQSYADFRFLIINDASTDESGQIIQSYTDSRIRYVRNEINLGLIASLNKGLELCDTEFLARMDQDDVALPQRLEVQMQYLQENPQAVLVASPILGITPGGKKRDHWRLDVETRTSEEIRKRMALQNCISHPTVVMRTNVIKSYRYSHQQVGSEDWDLWLRLLRDGHEIIKTKEVLLHYRIHPQSVTSLYRKRQHTQVKSALVKYRFLKNSVAQARLNAFVMRSTVSIFKDLAYYLRTAYLPGLARRTKWLFTISPIQAFRQFKALDKVLGAHDSRYFLFFPYSHLGGAEKVHAAIAKSVQEQQPFVFITGLHDHSPWLAQFGENQKVFRVAAALYHPLFSKQSRDKLLSKINATKCPVLLGANNRYYEELIPNISSSAKVIDLTHDFDYELNKEEAKESLSVWLRCEQRIFISADTLERCRKFYRENFADESDEQKLQVIMNGVDSPRGSAGRTTEAPFTILYTGRDTSEKRVDLIFKLAQKCEADKLALRFILAGPIRQRSEFSGLKNLELVGTIKDTDTLMNLYAKAHFCIITSISEGFPMSLMEAMMSGCVPLSTAVGDIPRHIHHGLNGFLSDKKEEETILNDFVEILRTALTEPSNIAKCSAAAEFYAKEHFSKVAFERSWKKVLYDGSKEF